MDAGLAKAIAVTKTRTALAEALGISPGAVSQWTAVPLSRVLDVEQITGVPREELRPDLFRSTKGETK
jgi:DNA-binding transcriptional regulator YdaS (Cro superfamily)